MQQGAPRIVLPGVHSPTGETTMSTRSAAPILCGLIAATFTISAHAHVFCVPSVAYPTLQSALDDAGTGGAFNAENNTIRIVRGTYSGGFTYGSADIHKLDINGGYNADCSTLIKNPALTILDGGTSVFFSHSTQGDVSLRYLTFQNGSAGGLIMNPNFGNDGPVIVDNNIIRNNHGSQDAGVFIATQSSDIHFDNNLLVGNVANDFRAAGSISSNGGGSTFITNNTVTQNTVTNSPGSATGGLSLCCGSSDVSNNIFWGNSGYDVNGNGVLVKNDFGTNANTAGAGSAGNKHVDPQFVSSSNFHLAETSPLLAQGTTTPAGGLPTIDLDGNSRVYSATVNTVDMGAYERGDAIFFDNFDR
jgi:hypothetical protein